MGIRFLYGYLWGFIPTNITHAIVYLLLGIAALAAGIIYYEAARGFARVLTWIMGIFFVLGFLPWNISKLFGLMPLWGWNVLINAAGLVLAWYFGYVYDIERREGVLE
jgi:hypothetical protein